MAVFTAAERDRLAKSIFSRICDREYYDKTKGRWITVRGAHVKIDDDGTVLAGPPGIKQHAEAGGFSLDRGKEKIGRGVGTESKFAETSKGKQVNLFHGLNDKPGQNMLFGGLDLAGATAADLKPEAKAADYDWRNDPKLSPEVKAHREKLLGKAAEHDAKITDVTPAGYGPSESKPESSTASESEAPAWSGLRMEAERALNNGNHDKAARRYKEAADAHPDQDSADAKELREKADKIAGGSKPAAEPDAAITAPAEAPKLTRTAKRRIDEARMHKAMADYYRQQAGHQSPAEAKRLKALADDHDKMHADKTAKTAKPAADKSEPSGEPKGQPATTPPAAIEPEAEAPGANRVMQPVTFSHNIAGHTQDVTVKSHLAYKGFKIVNPHKGSYVILDENGDKVSEFAGQRGATEYIDDWQPSPSGDFPKGADRTGNKPQEFKSSREGHGAILHPSSKNPGQWQVTRFDHDGFSGDTQYKDREQALREMKRDGYDQTGDQLSKLSGTDKFATGNEKTHLIGMMNQGADHKTIMDAYNDGGLDAARAAFPNAKEVQTAAISKARAEREAAERKTAVEPTKPETQPEAPKAVTSQPKKNLLHALKDKASPEAREMPTAAAVARGEGPHRLTNELGEKPPAGVSVGPGGVWTGSATLHADDIAADPSRFQYKVSGVGAKGVTKQLADVKRFNPMFGGQVMVWRDPADGKTYMINGHHRLDLAQRSPHYEDETTGLEWKGQMQSFYIPAKTAAQARAMGALANMAAGHGTATDAAKFMRDTGLGVDALKQQGISLKGKLAADAVALKDLSPRSFDDMVRGTLPESRAVAVSKHVKDPERQDLLLRKLAAREAAGRPVSDDAAEQAAKEVSLAGTTQERGGGLFGDMGEHSLEIERGEVKSAIRKAIASERNTFKAVSSAKRAGRLSESGNVLDVEGNRQRADQADETLGMFDTLANSKSGVSKEIQEAAEKYYHEPSKRDEIIRGLVSRLPGIIETDWREFSGKPEPETYAGRIEGVHCRGAVDAGTGDYRTRNNGARPMASRPVFNLNDRDTLTLALRPAIETYSRWEESKHHRGQPGNSGQFGPGGGHAAAPQSKAPSAPGKPPAPAKPTGSQAAHGTSSADYTPAKDLKPQFSKSVRAGDLLNSLNQGRNPEEALNDNLAHRSPAVQSVEQEYPPANHNGSDTLERHRMPDGSFTPQRKALHDKILGSILAKIPPSADKTFTLMGGGPASGKSSVINSGQVTLAQAAHIDADAIKTQLPEYNAMQGAKDMRAASFVHEESSGVGKTAMSQAFSGGQNVLLDGTGNASLDSVKAKANAARQAGYKVNAEYVTCDVEEAVRRNVERAKKTGRLPPEGMLRHTHKSVSQILPQAIAEGVFDNVRLWDTQNHDANGQPSLVASGKGNQLTVHNQQLWDTFLAKGK